MLCEVCELSLVNRDRGVQDAEDGRDDEDAGSILTVTAAPL